MIKEFINNFKNDVIRDGKKHWKLIVVGVVLGLIISSVFSGQTSKVVDPRAGHDMSASGEKNLKYWTCSMHPQIKLPKEGQCPLCGMDLIPVYEGISDDQGDDSVSITLNRIGRELAEVETVKVQYKEVSNEVRLVGKVDYDETRLSYISAWVAGRIDQLFVDFTGTRVRKGDHLIKLYSPELLATQEEYLQAIKNSDESKESQLSVIRDTAQTTLNSSKEKLRLYGISEEQIKGIVDRGKPDELMTIYSSVTGTVIHKNGFEGMYVKTGDKIYTIADLSRVWLYLDAYESDIQWLHYGQKVKVETESYPGEVFSGKVAFVDPFVNEKTRTIKLRVNVENSGEKLKPGMFVRATIKAVLGDDGKIFEPDLANKWICPMHPDVIKDEQAPCDVCGMDLIRTSEFGFVDNPMAQRKVLIIPKTAPLITGKRAVVYVENETDKNSIKRYEGREVVLGPRAGEDYVVLSGLKEGERVVTKGNFKIDSALQIQAKPSMMNPAGYYNENDNQFSQGVSKASDNAGVLQSALPYYLSASEALSNDNPHVAAGSLMKFKDSIDDIIRINNYEGAEDGIGADILVIRNILKEMDHNLESLRTQLSDVTGVLKVIFEKYEYKEDLKLYLNFCPMVFGNDGAYWIQGTDEIRNPYYGADMLKCGEIKAEYGRKIMESKPMTGHEGHQM